MRIPDYRPHKSGQARCQWRGRTIYFGKYGTPESRQAYQRFVHSITTAEAPPVPYGQAIPVALLVAHYLNHAREYYSKAQYDHCRQVGQWLVAFCGQLEAAKFSPLKFRAFRDSVMAPTRSRSYINDQMTRVKRIFRWAAGREIVPASVLEGLRAVENLKPNRSAAPERPRVRPVEPKVLEAVLPYLAPTVATMLQVQRLTGMRSQQLCDMRWAEIDRSQRPWIYAPAHHKNQWRGRELVIQLGPRVQRLLAPYLPLDDSEYLFSPARAVEEKNSERARRRKTKPSKNPVTRKAFPKRKPGRKYTSASYRRALWYAIRQAEKHAPVPHFHPHQVRHARATELRRTYKLEGAKVALGHAHVSATQLYAEADIELARRIALETG